MALEDDRGEQWRVDRAAPGGAVLKHRMSSVSHGRYLAFQMAEVDTSFSCVTISTRDAGLLVDPFADARKNLGQSQHEMLAAGHLHKRLRLIGEFEKLPGQAYLNDIVFVSVQDEDRNMHVADREVRAKPIEHQPIHRKDRIMRRGDLHRRRIGRIEHESGSFMRRREGGRDACAERFAHQNDTIAVGSFAGRRARRWGAPFHRAKLCG
jgi:hypothetical protein